MNRLIVVAVLGSLMLVATGVTAALLLGGGDLPTAAYRGNPVPVRVALPDFSLKDYTGKRVQASDLQRKIVIVTFLDTKCTTSCPIIASQVASGLRLLTPDERSQVVAVAISTQPTDDTPAAVRAFLRRHRAEHELLYLIGSEQELRPVWEAFYILSALDSGNANTHSAPVRVFDRNGRWVSTLHPGVDLTPDNLRHDITLALSRS